MLFNYAAIGFYLVLLFCIVASDYKTYKIPNILVFPGMVLAVFVNILQGTWQSSLIGGFVVLAMFVASIKLMKAPVGMGDLKLAMLIGFMLGFPMGIWAVFAGVFGGAVVSLILIKTGVVKATINPKTLEFKTNTNLPMALFLGVSAGVFLVAGLF